LIIETFFGGILRKIKNKSPKDMMEGQQQPQMLLEVVTDKVDFPAEEERVLRWWKQQRIFKRSLELAIYYCSTVYSCNLLK
jgi:hypothetical protein